MFVSKLPISYAEFQKLDIRTGTVVEASKPDWSKKLLRFVVDFGEEIGRRTIFAGVQQWYTPDELLGKQYCFLVNLEPKKMGEEQSEGMMLMADNGERPTVLPLSQAVKNGDVIR